MVRPRELGRLSQVEERDSSTGGRSKSLEKRTRFCCDGRRPKSDRVREGDIEGRGWLEVCCGVETSKD